MVEATSSKEAEIVKVQSDSDSLVDFNSNDQINGELSHLIDNRFLDTKPDSSLLTHGLVTLILLNQPIEKEAVLRLIAKSSLIICADGGANQLYDCLQEDERLLYLPNAVVGDLDSVRVEVKDFYLSNGVHVEKVFDQNHTDLEKCIRYVTSHQKIHKPENLIQMYKLGRKGRVYRYAPNKILAYPAFGGRMDHTLSALHALAQYRSEMPECAIHTEVVLLSNESLMLLLEIGETKLYLSESFELKAGCGLIPLGTNEVSLCTTGLKWNLGIYNQESNSVHRKMDTLAFGHFISTSNETTKRYIRVVTEKPIFWCSTVAHL